MYIQLWSSNLQGKMNFCLLKDEIPAVIPPSFSFCVQYFPGMHILKPTEDQISPGFGFII